MIIMNGCMSLLKIRPVRFILVGAMNTAFSYFIYSFFLFFSVNYAVANLLALIAGIFFSFHTQGFFVFRNTQKNLFHRYIFSWLAIYIANIFMIKKLIECGFNSYTSGALTLIPIGIFSYFLHKFFIFRHAAQH
jgi:putative flippase GtrA